MGKLIQNIRENNTIIINPLYIPNIMHRNPNPSAINKYSH